MHQLALMPGISLPAASLRRCTFSHRHVCREEARLALEQRYGPLLEETHLFDRRLVSFQANKSERLHRWIKFREGFSATLVERLMEHFQLAPGDIILDPFAGSGTTLLVAQMLGIHSVGIELLPHNNLTWQAKTRVFTYRLAELRQLRAWIQRCTPPPVPDRFPHIAITESAFPPEAERALMAYKRWFEQLPLSEDVKLLSRFLLLSIVEEVSYTRKDGQYLRWDARAEKIRRRNIQRAAKGKPPTGIHKGPLPDVRTALMGKLEQIIADVEALQRTSPPPSTHTLLPGNALYLLPTLESERFAAVITSPPYANRYDYTRTYALELAFLNVGEKIFDLRQEQLSCTVENRPKSQRLERLYHTLGRPESYERVIAIVRSNAALTEIDEALRLRAQRGEVNNRGILTMVSQYFLELAFIFHELYRVCRPGAYVAVVNDNVRYAGEIIPVDLLSTDLAAAMGFRPVKVYVLPQRKGNSSQQMERFGREALRKSITIWRKPEV